MSCVQLEMEKKPVVRGNCLRLLRDWLIWIYGVTAFISLFVLIVFWCTNLFHDAILNDLPLRNGTLSFTWWQRPPVRLVYKVYIFNYTNIDEFNRGEVSKLKLAEVGPYVYKETLARVNVEIHENGTVTYQEKRSYDWDGGSPDDDVVVVPNVPLLSAIAFSRNIHFVARVGLTAFLTTLDAKTFVTVPAGGFIWGYDDQIFEMTKPLIALKQPLPFDKFGMLAYKNGMSSDRITMHTGVGDISKLGLIERLNGLESRNVWGDEKCDRIYGTDGSIFPPHLVEDTNATLDVYSKDMCRKLPFRYHGHGHSHGIPTFRYKLPADVFTSSDTKDTCYCPRSTKDSTSAPRVCPPAGLFNLSLCNFESPLLTSFPHFYSADKSLLDEVDGLEPREELHETYVDLHPRLGLPIDGRSRFQVNLEVRKAIGVPFLGKLRDGSILPLFWVETGISDIPVPVLDLLHEAHFTAAAVEAICKWGGLIVFSLSFGALIITLRKRLCDRHSTLKRNVSGQNRLLE